MKKKPSLSITTTNQNVRRSLGIADNQGSVHVTIRLPIAHGLRMRQDAVVVKVTQVRKGLKWVPDDFSLCIHRIVVL